jgi:hypothetical protein
MLVNIRENIFVGPPPHLTSYIPYPKAIGKIWRYIKPIQFLVKKPSRWLKIKGAKPRR